MCSCWDVCTTCSPLVICQNHSSKLKVFQTIFLWLVIFFYGMDLTQHFWVLSYMIFINTYQFCHKLLLYAYSFNVFILLPSSRMFTLAVNILDKICWIKTTRRHIHGHLPPCLCVCVCGCSKKYFFIAEQTCIIACTGSTGWRYSYSDSVQKEEVIPDLEQRTPSWKLSPAEALGMSWNGSFWNHQAQILQGRTST